MAQPSKEMKALLLECKEYGINEKQLKVRTELILKTYQTKMYELMMEKEARGAGNLQEEVIEDLYVLRDFRIATDSCAFRKAVRTVSGLGYLAAICAAGLALGLLAVLILKKRHMEAAGEIVAVPVLRPLFRICMSVGTAVVVACILCQEFLSRIVYGRGLAVCACVLLALGAALGWFAAEMLIKKSLRVFGRGWKQIGIIAGLLVLLAILAEADVTGY